MITEIAAGGHTLGTVLWDFTTELTSTLSHGETVKDLIAKGDKFWSDI